MIKINPLEKARLNQLKICCNNCKNKVVVNYANYCEESGKLIMNMHLDTRRDEQCKERFVRK